MFRLAGLLGIVLSLGLLGILKAQQLKTRVTLLEDFLQAMLGLKGRISYFKEPLPLVFGKVNGKSGSKASELLSEAGKLIAGQEAEIAEIWSACIDDVYKGTPLTENDVKALKYAGSFIGQTDCDNHLFHFGYLEEKLAEQIEEGRSELREKGPMYRKIGFFLGAILAILFI